MLYKPQIAPMQFIYKLTRCNALHPIVQKLSQSKLKKHHLVLLRKQFFLFQNKTWFFPLFHNRERVNDRRRSSVFYTSFLFPWSANQRPVEGGNGIGVQRVQRGNNANAVHGEEDRVWHWSVLEVVEFLLTHSVWKWKWNYLITHFVWHFFSGWIRSWRDTSPLPCLESG